MSEGRYIAIEGGDGSGKTYFIDNRLRGLIEKYTIVHEPNNYRETIKLLLNQITPVIESNMKSLDDIVQITHIMYATFNMLMADRYMHHQTIDGYIKNGHIVISDRCIMSSYVYQFRLLHSLIGVKKNNSFYKEPKIVGIMLDYMFDQIYEFTSNRELMPDRILILNQQFKRESEENIDNSQMLQELIQSLYINIHSDGLCPIALKKNSSIIDSSITDEKLLMLINK